MKLTTYKKSVTSDNLCQSVIQTKETKFQKYAAYKHSGVEWLGEIPEEWEVKRFKNLFKEINERSIEGNGDLLSVSQYTGVTKKSDKIEEGDMLTTASSLEGYKKVYRNDLVSNIMLAWNGSLGFSDYEGITSPAYSVYRLKKENSTKFFHYLLRSQLYKSEFKRKSSGIIESRLRLYTDDFYAIWSILPPLSEQIAIAAFLDDKTAKIDRAIAQKEKTIALLKERKQIIIQDLVTGKKVWNGKQNAWTEPAEVKHSGVEWIGEIPKDWEVKRLKYVLKIRNEKVGGLNSNKIYVGMENIESNTGKYIENKNDAEGLANVFYQDDILFGKLRPYLAKVYLAEFDGICSPELIVYKSSNPKYFSKLLLSDDFIQIINASTYGAKMPRANSEFIGNQEIPIPSMKEQSLIVQEIETQSAKIDHAISIQEQQIEKLKEYKSVLIDSAVTGKIKIA